MTHGTITVLTSEQPKTLGKVFEMTADGLKKSTSGEMTRATFEVVRFDGIEALAAILTSCSTSQAITTSLPRNGSQSGLIVTRCAKSDNPCAIARTKADFGFPEGAAGVMILDYDPVGKALSRDELWAIVREVVPTVESAGVLWWCSGSSFVYDRANELQGLRGQRLYICIVNLADTERAGLVLQKRLWLAGHGRIEVSKSGALLQRTPFDAAMAQAARVDFCGGSVCKGALRQLRPAPVILASGGWLDTAEALPDLTASEQATYEDLVTKAKREAMPQSEIVKASWVAERKNGMVSRLMAEGVGVVEAVERSDKVLTAALAGSLLGDFEIPLVGGGSVTVGEMLDDRAKWHGVKLPDPLEPTYKNGSWVATAYLYGGHPTIASLAHGGQTFRLYRQPARLYLTAGGKAELASEIVRRLATGGEVFKSGGLLCRVEGGRGRRLERAALTHLIQTQMSFYGKNAKGEDVARDLPGDVVDMVIAIA